MSGLPIGWIEVTLGQITSKPQYGYTTKSQSSGSVRYLRTTDLTSGKVNWDNVPYCADNPADVSKYQLEDRDIVISRAGSVGFHSLICSPPDNVVFASYLIRFKPSSFINERYLSRFLNSQAYWSQITEKAAGVAVQNVNAVKLADLKIPLAPLNEQKRIADKLDSILAKVDRAQARLDKIPGILKRFRQSVLAAATSGELTKEWRDSNINESTVFSEIQELKINWARENAQHNEANRVLKRATEYDNKKPRINVELPSSWAFESLEDCVLMIVDCHNKTAPYVQSGIPLIRTSNIRDGKFIWEDLKFVDEETYAFWSKRCPPEQGDIIFTREAPMGEAAIIPPGQKVCLGQRTMLIRPIESHISASYLLLTIMDPGFKRRSDLLAVGTGVKHYRVGDVSNLKIPIPSSSEQTEIVRRVHDLFALAEVVEKNYVDTIKRVNLLSKSVLAKAFRGELVEQNTSDEPASDLLMRIKQQQSDAPKVARQARKSAIKVKSTPKEIDVELSEQESGILTLLKKTNGQLSAQQIMEQLTEKTFEQIDALFTELKRLLDNNSIVKVGSGEACTFKAIKR